jgi:hypothetical protein
MMGRYFVHIVYLIFCVGRGWTSRDELYGIIDESIDPDLSLYEPIGIPETSTFDLQVCMILSCHRLEHGSLCCDREV